MKMAVVCANGKAGKLIVKEAVERGMDVTAVVRGENRSVAPKAIIKDVFELQADDLKGFDVVVAHLAHGRRRQSGKSPRRQNTFQTYWQEPIQGCLW